jgi:hypothetical protein
MNPPAIVESDAELAHYLETALALVRARSAGAMPDAMLTPPAPEVAHQFESRLTEAAREIYRSRRRRERYFDLFPDAFGEPAWDLMLDLFIANREGRRVSVSSAAIAANVPPTTALRWIGLLEERGVIRREPDNADRRRSWLHLEETVCRQMERYIGDCVVTGAAARVSAHCLSSVASA